METQHPDRPRRLSAVDDHHYRPVAIAALWRALLVALAITLILVLLPAVLEVQAAT